ncbi:MAG: DUF262 domain-containing HNH endonuclease family protein [Roseburia sp.]|nr:DUF262 domain-containing HNH endonuclease family protein [Roseburia sp.]
MSKLNIDQQTIKELFSNKRSDFLIPDYQRPYAWGETECQTLWDDVFSFAFPENDYTKFNSDEDEYFLGPIVTFKNNNKLEIIDGQQRLTTFMLMLRAFYSKFGNMKDPNATRTSEDIAKCIWKTDEFGKPDKDRLKIDSEVSTDEDKKEFLSILKTGSVDAAQKSRYAKVYRFFQEKINGFLQQYPSYFSYLPTRILNNCILLPIEAESQDTALRIFSTLNDRGKPLSDTDIFKAKFYKFYSDQGKTEEFIKRWENLEVGCGEIFSVSSGSPMDELFTRYMYYERAKQGIRLTTTEALRKFYEKNEYEILKRNETLRNLEDLLQFWERVSNQDDDAFSDKVLRRLAVLNYAPNGMWTYLVSVYFMQYRDQENLLDDDAFFDFLNKITAFIWMYAFVRPGVNALRSPVYPEMIEIVSNRVVDFEEYRFDVEVVRNAIENYVFTNGRPITKSMLAWWAYNNKKQELISLDMPLEIEHIFPRKRQENEGGFIEESNLESLGNKVLLEKSINVRATDYRFEDKKKYYKGFTNSKGKYKEGTKNVELLEMAESQADFQEADIVNRKKEIIDEFLRFLELNHLIK